MAQAYFITGIGTDIGKSWATGWLAKAMAAEGKSVMTQKFIQTGNKEMSEDILLHRRIMGIPLTSDDQLGITAPEIFSYPASPHLAAIIDKRDIDFKKIQEATRTLLSRYDNVLIEGAGGLMVPLAQDYLTIDYIRDSGLPAVLVTNGRLGSISDTLLALYALKSYGISLYAVIYNPHFDNDPLIAADTYDFIRRKVEMDFPDTKWLLMPRDI